MTRLIEFVDIVFFECNMYEIVAAKYHVCILDFTNKKLSEIEVRFLIVIYFLIKKLSVFFFCFLDSSYIVFHQLCYVIYKLMKLNLVLSASLLLVHLDGVPLFHLQRRWRVVFVYGLSIETEPDNLHGKSL